MSDRKKPPILIFSGLTNTVYIVTRYTDRGDDLFIAHEKHDVTDQFVNLARGDAAGILVDNDLAYPDEDELGG